MSRHIANALARMRRFEPILAYAVADEDLRAVPEIVADNYAGEACLRNAIGLADCHDEARHDEARGDHAVIRSEERRVGKAWGRQGRSRWTPYSEKKKKVKSTK